MNGCVLDGTPLVVDFWQTPDYHESKAFFLTHLHEDHTKGLTSLWRKKIYTSPLNCLLLKQKFQLQDEILVPLELDDSHIIFIDEECSQTVTVTPIDANHVPGSVIFLFQGPFGNILYTGDMRFYAEIFEHPVLKHVLKTDGIDELYLDNTFLHPNYDFPSRKKATQMVFDIIERYPTHVIKLGIRKLGKEDLLEAIAQKFNSLIYVDQVKYDQIQILNRPKVYTTKMEDTRFHAINLNRIHSRNHQKWNECNPTVSIRLTAIEFGIHPDERSMMNTEGIFLVPYSDHSSYSELRSFVASIKPKRIIPIVKRNRRKKDRISVALEGNDDMSVLSEFISAPWKPSTFVSIPVSSYFETCKPLRHTLRLQSKPCVVVPKKKKKNVEKGVFYTTFEEDENTLKYDEIKSATKEVVSNQLSIETNVNGNLKSPSRISNTEMTTRNLSESNEGDSQKTVTTYEMEKENSTCNILNENSLNTPKELNELQSNNKRDGSPNRLLATDLNHVENLLQIESPSRPLNTEVTSGNHSEFDEECSRKVIISYQNNNNGILSDQSLRSSDDGPNRLLANTLVQAGNLLHMTRNESLDRIGSIFLNLEEFNNNLQSISSHLDKNYF